MRPFSYARAPDAAAAVSGARAFEGRPGGREAVQYLAGGTNLLDYMKLDVLRPEALIDINELEGEHGRIELDDRELRLGGLVRMTAAERHPQVVREFPALAQSLALAASPQLRNMASLAGNVLQRTRCGYFRDVSYPACNKRAPGSGCSALTGVTRPHAVLGVSDACIASYPGDFAQALVALDARVELLSPAGRRALPFEALHRASGEDPAVETDLRRGELITGFAVPRTPLARRSLYLKIRDRSSYAFALASAAVALEIDGEGRVRAARIALGGVAGKPWRAKAAERALEGGILDENSAAAAAALAFKGARTTPENAFKVSLGRRVVARALLEARELEI